MTIYNGTQINNTAVYVFKAAEVMADPRCKAITVTADGAKIATGSTAPIMGVALITNDFPIQIGEDVHVQIKEIGLIELGATVAPGQAVTAGAQGKGAVASTGHALGVAMSAGVAGDKIPVQITKLHI